MSLATGSSYSIHGKASGTIRYSRDDLGSYGRRSSPIPQPETLPFTQRLAVNCFASLDWLTGQTTPTLTAVAAISRMRRPELAKRLPLIEKDLLALVAQDIVGVTTKTRTIQMPRTDQQVDVRGIC